VSPPDVAARVTPLELFFDLVFVFALTQVTALMAEDLSIRGVVRGLLLLALLWWSWVGFAWLGNVARADEGSMRLAMIGAMATMFVVALTIPEAFGDLPGGLHGPVVIALSYFVFRAIHLAMFWLVGSADDELRHQLVRFAPSMLAATTLLLLASRFTGAVQTLLWAAALLADYVGTMLAGASGWRLRSAVHFAERHGLIVIVALGESIVAIGVGVAAEPISWPIVVAAWLGLSLSAGLWWLYFDVTSRLGEQALAHVDGERQARLGRDAFSYLHLPLVAGVVLLALGLKKVLEYVSDTEHHPLSDPLTGIGLLALYGGVALYLLGHVAFKLRLMGSLSRDRVIGAVAVAALTPVAATMPALAALGLLTLVVLALLVFEAMHYAQFRDAVRH
jgi:low temperature requirement protein LtrA